MYCPTCGKPNPDDGTFCATCGNVLPGRAGNAAATVPPPRATPTIPPKPGATPPVGEVKASLFAGRYELLHVLGKGGMGVVYRAKDIELGEEIAIKLLQPQFTKDAHEVERFKREILTARRITHPNVIRIHDYGTSGEEFFISMELLPGGTLADRIARGIPIPEAARVGAGIADGLAAAHAKNVVHRDIKPHNVLFDADGTPKLVDFGIARFATATKATRGFAGTPHYISPEQAKGQDATERSDVYSLGVLLFELFTGRLPFDADSLVALAVKHAHEPPPPPRSLRPDLPPALEAIVLRCLEKDPARRYATPAEIAADLRAAEAGSATGGARPATVAEALGSAASPRPTPPPPRTTPAPAAPAPMPAPAPAARPAPAPLAARATPVPSGTPVPSHTPVPVPAPPPRRSSCGLLVGIFAVIIAIGCGGLFFLGLLGDHVEKRKNEALGARLAGGDDDEPDPASPARTATPLAKASRAPTAPAVPTPPSLAKVPPAAADGANRYTTAWGWSFAPPAGWQVQALPDGSLLLPDPSGMGGVKVVFAFGSTLDEVRRLGPQPVFFTDGLQLYPSGSFTSTASGRGLALDYAGSAGYAPVVGRGAAIPTDGGVAVFLGVAQPDAAAIIRSRVDALASSVRTASYASPH